MASLCMRNESETDKSSKPTRATVEKVSLRLSVMLSNEINTNFSNATLFYIIKGELENETT